MGRGRAKAKQTKVARELKYHSPNTDLAALRRSWAVGPVGSDSDASTTIHDADDEDEDESDDSDERRVGAGPAASLTPPESRTARAHQRRGADLRPRCRAGGRVPPGGPLAAAEEREHLVQGVAGRVARLVDQVLGEHRVRVRRDAVRVAGRRVDLHGDERVAQLPAQRLEPLAGTHRSPVKRRPSRHAPSAARSLTRARSAGADTDRGLCRAAMANGSDGWLSTGASIRSSTIIAEREPAGEAHPDRADAGAAALLVRLRRQRPQPADDRTGPAGREIVNSRETQARAAAERCTTPLDRPARVAEQRREVRGEARVDHPAREVTTPGCRPGISWMTITAGPVPAR